MNNVKWSVTYSTWTDEDLELGESSDAGWIAPDHTMNTSRDNSTGNLERAQSGAFDWNGSIAELVAFALEHGITMKACNGAPYAWFYCETHDSVAFAGNELSIHIPDQKAREMFERALG